MHWVSNPDAAIAEADSIAAQASDAVGGPVVADSGDRDPTAAIRDALVGFPADRIVGFCRDQGAGEAAYGKSA